LTSVFSELQQLRALQESGCC